MKMKIITLITWLALLTGMAYGGERTMCHFEPADAGGWHYRTKVPPLMDAQCWYLGERMKPRRELYWAEAPSIPAVNITEPEPETEFHQRWKGER
jgi:hypothetical protein